MFGRDVESLKGKITRQQLQAVLSAVANNLPKEIMEHCCNIMLCVDIMFVNPVPFFVSISKRIRFVTAEALDNCKEGLLVKALQRICGICRKRGFCITHVHGDSEFECARGAVATDLRSDLNICGKDEERAPDVEHCVSTTKERTRCTCDSTTIEHCPPRMIIEMVFMNIVWINGFPHRLGVSQTLSPCTIVTGLHIDCHKRCRVACGQHVQTQKKHDSSMEARAVGALALLPTGNS
jgi:acetolactate synthase regulatory subunit